MNSKINRDKQRCKYHHLEADESFFWIKELRKKGEKKESDLWIQKVGNQTLPKDNQQREVGDWGRICRCVFGPFDRLPSEEDEVCRPKISHSIVGVWYGKEQLR